MSFRHGKDKGERARLRQILDNPHSSTADKHRARQILQATSPSLQDKALPPDTQDETNLIVAQQLLGQIEEHLHEFRIAEAKALIDDALQLATVGSLRAEILDLSAQILMEEDGLPAQVLAVLQEAEFLTPNTSHERCLTIAQLSNEETSLQHYEKAIALLRTKIATIDQLIQQQQQQQQQQPNKSKKSNQNNKSRQQQQQKPKQSLEELQQDKNELLYVMSCAQVSCAELYTTDLCDDDDAEVRCTTFLQQALESCPINVDAIRAMGNLCIIQGKQNEAIKYSIHAFQTLKQLIQQGKDEYIPEFVPRLELARQLFELQSWQEAIALLCGLLQEEEYVAEIWYYAMFSSCKLAENIHQEIQRLQNISNGGGSQQQQQIQQLTIDRNDYLSCAAQYAVRCQVLLKQSPDTDLENQVATCVTQLESLGFSLQDAKKQLTQMRNASDNEAILDTMDFDDENNNDDDGEMDD